MYFHFNHFSGIKAELEAVKNIVNAIDDFNEATIKEISFSEKSKQEKAIFRLVRIGVFKDYAVDGALLYSSYVSG